MQIGSIPVPFNGPISADAFKSLKPGTIFDSASRGAATYTTQEFFNACYRGVQLFINVSDKGAAGTLTVKIQVLDPISGTWVDLPDATTAALNANGETILSVHPDLTDDANAEVSASLPARWRLAATVAANAVTFSIAGFYLP